MFIFYLVKIEEKERLHKITEIFISIIVIYSYKYIHT